MRKAVASVLCALVVGWIVGAPGNPERVGQAQDISSPSTPPLVDTDQPLPDRLSSGEQLDILWARSDWATIIGLLEKERTAGRAETYPELDEKLYAAYVNGGYDKLREGERAGAKRRFLAAQAVDPARPEAGNGLKRLARSGALLELLPDRECTRKLGFILCRGTVTNISGRPLANVMVVATHTTDAGVFVTRTKTFLQHTLLDPDGVSAFLTFTRDNPAIASWQVEFKEPFGGVIPHYQD